ncbi:MAG: hypothetical protein IJS60_03970 [Abditibacteriota bacterium]|nr:hypothetical protein [Abditibacteriota bacterium]
MKKVLFLIILISLSISVWADGMVLWPQLTDGIYNQNKVQAMHLVIGEDGLTVTDTCYDTYQVPGCVKRWNIDMGETHTEPLKDYKFDESFAGLPVTITMELYNPEDYWRTVENYQEIIILGGKQNTISFPPWFSIPTDRLAYDFDENPTWPRDFTLPKGKLAIWQGASKVRQRDIEGKSPMLRFGFTHVGPCALSKGEPHPDKKNLGMVFSDNEWIKCNPAGTEYEDPTNPETWQKETFLNYAKSMEILIADFEMPGAHAWQDYQFEAFKKIIDETREAEPGAKVGCWGVAPANYSIRMFDDIDELGRGTGVVNETGAKKWRDLYKDPSVMTNQVFKRCDLNFGNPSVYFINNTKPSQLYAFLQEYEMSKILRPDVLDVLSTWIQVEFVDGYNLTPYSFKDAEGRERCEWIKHQVPASLVYALSLFGHCVMDGLHCWEVGTYYSEDLKDYYNWGAGEPASKAIVNGEEYPCNYYVKYFGFYNYHVLGMWQASQNKDIIEADTKWFMPEYKSSKNDIWRVGDEVFPSYANLHKEPLIRAKLSKDGKELLVVADNPYNQGLEKVKIHGPNSEKEFSFELVGAWPQIKRFKVNN